MLTTTWTFRSFSPKRSWFFGSRTWYNIIKVAIQYIQYHQLPLPNKMNTKQFHFIFSIILNNFILFLSNTHLSLYVFLYGIQRTELLVLRVIISGSYYSYSKHSSQNRCPLYPTFGGVLRSWNLRISKYSSGHFSKKKKKRIFKAKELGQCVKI